MEREVRELVGDLLAERIDTQRFRDSFVAASWNVQAEEPATAGLVYKIELMLSENDEGVLSDSQMLRELRPLAAVQWFASPPVTRSLNQVLRPSVRLALAQSAAAHG